MLLPVLTSYNTASPTAALTISRITAAIIRNTPDSLFLFINAFIPDKPLISAPARKTIGNKIPQTVVELTTEDDIKKMRRILNLLDEEDDVQNVYHNWDEPEEDEE